MYTIPFGFVTVLPSNARSTVNSPGTSRLPFPTAFAWDSSLGLNRNGRVRWYTCSCPWKHTSTPHRSNRGDSTRICWAA